QFAADKDFRTLSALVEKGISGGPNAWRTLHMLTCQKQDCWIAEELLEKRMWVDTSDYNALHACVQNDAVEVCRLLLDGGMDFDQYRQWAQTRPCAGHEETLRALEDHWSEMQAEMEQTAPAQENGGMVLG
ncbi:ankyrin repeat domain-containing protein, partial [uncultured Oscillibacter sp.]|uniref:ankyrin repeat domain-containing protein n=1 Tax=uncultured Oscillibacter sp. TaxID=876091 RepID=UPI003439FFA2